MTTQDLIDNKLLPLLMLEFNPKETLKLLHADYRFHSWGAREFTNVRNKGLLFKVNGHHHKGWVFIALEWSDTYAVYIISNKGEILNTYLTIYFDELFDTIDKRIEYIAEYKK